MHHLKPLRRERHGVSVAASPLSEIGQRVLGGFKGAVLRDSLIAALSMNCGQRGIWFKGAAGSSAGAITAMLIAAGYDPQQLIGLAGEALQKVRKNRLTWLSPRQEQSLKRRPTLPYSSGASAVTRKATALGVLGI